MEVISFIVIKGTFVMSLNISGTGGLKNDPLLGYVGDALKNYIETLPLTVGGEMMIYGSHGMLHTYKLVTVEAVNVGRQKRVVVSEAGAWGGKSFYRTGRNCFSPKGQARLIPPIPWLKSQVNARREVVYSWDWTRII